MAEFIKKIAPIAGKIVVVAIGEALGSAIVKTAERNLDYFYFDAENGYFKDFPEDTYASKFWPAVYFHRVKTLNAKLKKGHHGNSEASAKVDNA